ncbi:hypothetical protein BEN35_30245 [Streptomyces fradiae]|nr:hypothetical protein BEN35_30245 [Streptomyces fradiae]
MLRVERLRDASRRPLLVVVTDGRATAARSAGAGGRGGTGDGARAGRAADPFTPVARAAHLLAAEGTASVVVDCESGPVRLGLAGELARRLGAEAVTLEELRADSVAGLVRGVRGTRRAPSAQRTGRGSGPVAATRPGTAGTTGTTETTNTTGRAA